LLFDAVADIFISSCTSAAVFSDCPLICVMSTRVVYISSFLLV